ncbi:hypothetical protein GCM10009730_42260 [Streptomyces albidochromogenes]|uniref:hypothetical protein n=1 Tax=Streptomyces albidochromogenes TaxID=329524 RepID=UPI00110FB023|nr:hypothetical protein [Streptomyces albidochromogenes]
MPSKLAQQMNELIRGQQPQPSASQDKSADIRAMYKQGLQQIRGQRNLHPDAKRVETARLYANARAALDKVMRDQIAADTENWGKLERRLWGYDDARAHATTAADRAALDSTIRDAADRAAQIKKPSDAAHALKQAEQAGDQILARAIGKRACDMDWDDVLGDYLGTRSSASTVYLEMCEIHQRQQTANGALAQRFAASLAKPDELRDLDDNAIEQMTADPGDAAA